MKDGTRRFLDHPFAGLVAIVACVLPFVLWRCALARTFWGDEMYTVVIANLPFDELIETCRADAHPPLYYLLIKAWLAVTGALGLEPSILLVRLPNAALWVSLCAVTWFCGRRLIGHTEAFLFTLLTATAAHSAFVSGDLRQYALLIMSLTACWLLLQILWQCACAADGRRPRREAVLWSVYALLAAIALWTQLLAGIFLFLLGLFWIILSVCLLRQGRGVRDPFILGGATANVIALTAFSPWLATVVSNLEYMTTFGGAWMPDATLYHLLCVFIFWYPLGRSGSPVWPLDSLILAFGALTLLAPLGALLMTRRAEMRKEGKARPELLLFAVSGLLIAFLFTFLLWLLMRLDLMQSFYGPRYPSIAIVPWIGGLAGAAFLAWRRTARSLVLLVLVPFAAASLFGWHFLLLRQRWGAPSLLVEQNRELLPLAGTPLYVVPETLIPYWEDVFADWKPESITALAEIEEDERSVTVLDLFITKDRRRSGVLFHAAKAGYFSDTVSVTNYPEYRRLLSIITLEGFHADAASRLGTMPWHRAVRPRMDDAISVAVPELQFVTDGWHLPRQQETGELVMWSSSETTRLVFDKPLSAGEYRVVIRGASPALPEAGGDVSWRFSDGNEGRIPFGQGSFTIELPIDLKAREENPSLVITYPTREDEKGVDRGFLFLDAVIHER